MLFTNTVFNATVLWTTSMFQFLLLPQMKQEYNKIGNVHIDKTLKRVHITTVATKSNAIQFGTAIIWWGREMGLDKWKNAVWRDTKHVRDLNFILYYYSISAEKFSLGGNHISGMKQKYISTIIFTSKLEIVDIWQKKNAYIAQQQGTHTHKDMLCTVTHAKQPVTMHKSIHPQPNLTEAHIHKHTYTRPRTHTYNFDLIITNMVHLLLARIR